MNKLYAFISAGFITGGLFLSSCSKDDKVINNNETSDIWDDNIKDFTVNCKISQPAPLKTIEYASSRATISNDKYIWQTGDNFTLWNRNLGRGGEFIITPEYQSESESANFTGKATINNGDKILAIYPSRDFKNFNDLKTFVLPGITEQTSLNGGLSASSFMVASATSGDIVLPDLNFVPLTALLQFNITNITDETITLKSVTISSDEKIFPTKMTINDNGDVTNLEETCESLVLNLNNQTVAGKQMFKGYLNVLPTTFGNTTFTSDRTNIQINANISVTLDGEIYETEVTLLRKTPLKDFAERFSFDMAETAYQFASGRTYPMALDVDYHFYVPEEGYIVDDEGNLEIYTPKGFKYWTESGETYKAKTVSLCAKPKSKIVVYEDESSYCADFSEKKIIDLGSEKYEYNNKSWTPINFAGTFEGEGFTVKNLEIQNKGGFFQAVSGIVNNLNITDVKYNGCTEKTGAFAVSNNATISNCSVKDVKMGEIKAKSPISAFVAENTNRGIINNCNIEKVEATLCPDGGGGNADLGAVAGVNNGAIINTKAINIDFNHTKNSGGKSNVGSFVGYNQGGKIKGCYAEANLKWSCSAIIGGLVGSNESGFIQASYVFGKIQAENNAKGHVGGLIGYNNAGKSASCYSTVQIEGNLPEDKGGFCGKDEGQKGIFNECYAICKDEMDPIKGNPSSGTKAENPQKIADEVRFFNYGLERLINFNMDVLPDVKVSFKKNDDTNTSSNQPIILVKESSIEPGFGGSDFGDGGSI